MTIIFEDWLIGRELNFLHFPLGRNDPYNQKIKGICKDIGLWNNELVVILKINGNCLGRFSFKNIVWPPWSKEEKFFKELIDE